MEEGPEVKWNYVTGSRLFHTIILLLSVYSTVLISLFTSFLTGILAGGCSWTFHGKECENGELSVISFNLMCCGSR